VAVVVEVILEEQLLMEQLTLVVVVEVQVDQMTMVVKVDQE
jgi:hypothetical protein